MVPFGTLLYVGTIIFSRLQWVEVNKKMASGSWIIVSMTTSSVLFQSGKLMVISSHYRWIVTKQPMS
ncbi:hypothetical protein EI751_12080 [Salmonella enterica]|nr:hypothetical protein [Salmonella enterica]